jgi:hypothetical protein
MAPLIRMVGQTRGQGNNNPGNIDRTKPRTPWQGRVADADINEPRFEQFVHAKWGIRAIAGTLMAYRDKHDLDTVRGMIDRWAPPVENNTSAYVTAVCASVGCQPDDHLDLQVYVIMRGLVVGIIQHENGKQPYSEALIEEGIKLSGVITNDLPSISRTMTGKATVGVAAAGGAAVTIQQFADIVQSASPLVASLRTLSPYIGITLIVCVAGYFLVTRMMHRQATGV